MRVDVDPRSGVEGAGVRVRAVHGVHVVGETAPLAHLGEEPRRHAAAEHDREELERVPVGMPELVAADAEQEVRLLGGLRVQRDRGGVRRQDDVRARPRLPRLDVAEQLLEPLDEAVPDAPPTPTTIRSGQYQLSR